MWSSTDNGTSIRNDTTTVMSLDSVRMSKSRERVSDRGE